MATCHRLLLAVAGTFALPVAARAQAVDSTADRVRTESGVDPTRIVSRASLSVEVVDLPGGGGSRQVSPAFGIGVGRWAWMLDWRWASVTAADGRTVDGLGDVGASVVFAAASGVRHSLALSAKVIAPVGPAAVSGDVVAVKPSATWAWSRTSRFVVAVQPQYTFTVARDAGVPAQSLITLRGFLASFRPDGLFAVAELRVLEDLEGDRTDVIVSPVLGWTIGAGFTLAALAEIPVGAASRDRVGTLVRTGVQKVL